MTNESESNGNASVKLGEAYLLEAILMCYFNRPDVAGAVLQTALPLFVKVSK